MSFSRRLLSRVFIPNSPPFPSRPPTYTHVARLQLGNAYTPGIRALGRRALLEMSSEQLLDSLRLKVTGKPSVLDEPLTNDGPEEEEEEETKEKTGGGAGGSKQQAGNNESKEERNNNNVLDEEEAQRLEKSSLFTFVQAFKVLRARDPALVRHLPVDVLTRIAIEAQATRSTQILDDLAADAVGTLVSVPSVQAELIRVLLERHTLLSPGTAAYLLATLRASGHLGIISPAAMTGMVRAALEQKGKNGESKREQLRSFTPYVLSLLEGTSLQKKTIVSAIWRPPESIVASLEFLRSLLAVGEEESALAVFQALVDVGFIPPAALEAADEAMEDFNLIIRVALVKACTHWGMPYETTGLLRDVVSSLRKNGHPSPAQNEKSMAAVAADDDDDRNNDGWKHGVASLVTETLFVLLETQQRHAIQQASSLMSTVSSALPSFRIPDAFLSRFFVAAMAADAGTSAEQLYGCLCPDAEGTEAAGRRHVYPPPPGATVRWLMEHLTQGSGNMHLARTLANQIVASVSSIAKEANSTTTTHSSSNMSIDTITTTTNATNNTNTTTTTTTTKKPLSSSKLSSSTTHTTPSPPTLPSSRSNTLPPTSTSIPIPTPSPPPPHADPVPLADRARFIGIVAQNGFGTQARTLWKHYASEYGRNAIVGNAALMLRMVSLFVSLRKMEERKAQMEQQPQQVGAVDEEEDALELSDGEDLPSSSSSLAPRPRPQSKPSPPSVTGPSLSPKARRQRVADYNAFSAQLIAVFVKTKQPLSRATHLDLNALARAYFMRGELIPGFAALRQLLRRQEIPDVVDLNVVLATLAEFDPHAAASVVDRMVERGLRPSSVTFGTVIHHALEKRDTALADALVARAKKLGVTRFDSKTVSRMLLASVSSSSSGNDDNNNNNNNNENDGTAASLFELRTNLARAYAIVKSMTRADFVATPGTGQRCVAAALRAGLPVLAFKFWMLLVRDKAEWADAEQVQERRALARAIMRHCQAGKLEVGRGMKMLAQLKAEGQREKAWLVEMVKMKR